MSAYFLDRHLDPPDYDPDPEPPELHCARCGDPLTVAGEVWTSGWRVEPCATCTPESEPAPEGATP